MPSKKPSQDKNQPDDASQLPLDLGADLGALIETSVGKPKKGKQKDPALTSPGRIERVTSREEFAAAVTTLGGDGIGIRNATGAIYKVAFNMTANQLYAYHGVKDRDFLPSVVQRLLQVHELVNAEALRNYTMPQQLEEQEAINKHIVVIVERQTKHTEVFLATFKLFGKGAQLGKRDPALKPKPPITIHTEHGPVECEVLEVDEGDILF